MLDPQHEEVLSVIDHIVENRIDIARPNVTASQACGPVVDPWRTLNLFVAHLTSHRIAKRRLDLSGQVISSGRERIIKSMLLREMGIKGDFDERLEAPVDSQALASKVDQAVGR